MKMYMALVQRTLFLYPPKPEPKVDLHRIPTDDRPKMRRLARMLHRVHLDQRHVFHDPRSGHSAKQILGPGSSHLFKQLVLRQGRKAVQAKELTAEEMLALKQYKKEHKTKVKLSSPAEMTADEILPSLTPFGFSDDSDFDPDDSTDSDSDDEEAENSGMKPKKCQAESLLLRVSRRKVIRQSRRAPPTDWHYNQETAVDQDDEPRMKSYPGGAALPAADPSRGMKKFYNYNGRWKNGKPHGHGTFIFATSVGSGNGEYVGDCENGQPHGFGVRYFRNGCLYEGGFMFGQMEGVGILKGSDRRVFYEGEFYEGCRHGKGRLTTKSGIVYEGMWVDGKRHGHGRETNRRGTMYVGQFKDDRIIGPGVLDLKKTDCIDGHHTQHFMRGNWYGYRFPETIREINDEIMESRRKKLESNRQLTKHLDQLALQRFVDEARDLIKEEKQLELEELAAAKRKELNDNRDALKAKREAMLNSLKAEVGGTLGDESDDDGDSNDGT